MISYRHRLTLFSTCAIGVDIYRIESQNSAVSKSMALNVMVTIARRSSEAKRPEEFVSRQTTIKINALHESCHANPSNSTKKKSPCAHALDALFFHRIEENEYQRENDISNVEPSSISRYRQLNHQNNFCGKFQSRLRYYIREIVHI